MISQLDGIEDRWPLCCRFRWSLHLRSSGMAEMLLGFGLECWIFSSTTFEKFLEVSYISFDQKKSQLFQSGSRFRVGGRLRTILVSKQTKPWFTVEKLWGLWWEKGFCWVVLEAGQYLCTTRSCFLVVACVPRVYYGLGGAAQEQVVSQNENGHKIGKTSNKHIYLS